jgi:pilus assembly protein Flp/PilA
MTQSLVSLLRDDDGATLVEYAMVIAFVVLVCVAAVTMFGGPITSRFWQFDTLLTAGS